MLTLKVVSVSYFFCLFVSRLFLDCMFCIYCVFLCVIKLMMTMTMMIAYIIGLHWCRSLGLYNPNYCRKQQSIKVFKSTRFISHKMKQQNQEGDITTVAISQM